MDGWLTPHDAGVAVIVMGMAIARKQVAARLHRRLVRRMRQNALLVFTAALVAVMLIGLLGRRCLGLHLTAAVWVVLARWEAKRLIAAVSYRMAWGLRLPKP